MLVVVCSTRVRAETALRDPSYPGVTRNGSSSWTRDRKLLDSAAVALPDLVTGPVFKFTSESTKDEEPPSDT